VSSKIALQWENVDFFVRHGFLMKSKTILRNINLGIPEGSILGLVGPNGAGKTTTIKLGAGLIMPASGKILIQGNLAALSMSRKTLGLLTEAQYFYPHLRVREWLEMMAGLSGMTRADSKKRIDDVLEMVELTGYCDQMMRTLSKGQLQRAGLAQALLHEPEILILDEPMSGLDPYWRYKVLNILLAYKKKGGTMVFSSHILSDVETLSDQVALLQNGQIVWNGRLKELDRKVEGYKIICYTSATEILEKIAEGNKIEKQPDGAWSFSIQLDKKADFLSLVASNNEIKVESLLPIQEELASVLFRTTVSP
jgi:ABC-2 type transport system ATP-binding protein